MLYFNLLAHETSGYKIGNVASHTLPLVKWSKIMVHLRYTRMHGIRRSVSYLQQLSSQLRLSRNYHLILVSSKTDIIYPILWVTLDSISHLLNKGICLLSYSKLI